MNLVHRKSLLKQTIKIFNKIPQQKPLFLSIFINSFCPSDAKFASCSDDGTVRVFDFLRCQEERVLRGK